MIFPGELMKIIYEDLPILWQVLYPKSFVSTFSSF